jgi:hypothetical protein
MENKEIYLILAFNTVHDWAICFQTVIFCGGDSVAAKDALTEAKNHYSHIETQVWLNNKQIRRSLHEEKPTTPDDF